MVHGWPCGFPSWARRFQEHVASAVCPPPAWAFLCVPLDGGTRPGQGSFPAGHAGPASALMVFPGVTRALGPELVRAGRSGRADCRPGTRDWCPCGPHGGLRALLAVRCCRAGASLPILADGRGSEAGLRSWDCARRLSSKYSHRPVSSHLWGLAAPFPTGLRAPRGRARRGVQRPLPRQAAPGSGVAAPRQGAGTTFALQHCCDFSDPWCVGVLGLAGHVTDIQ